MNSNEYNLRKRKNMNVDNMMISSYLKILTDNIPNNKLNAINYIKNIKQDLIKKYNKKDLYLLTSLRNLDNIQKLIKKNKNNNIKLLLKNYIQKLSKYEDDEDYNDEDNNDEDNNNDEDYDDEDNNDEDDTDEDCEDIGDDENNNDENNNDENNNDKKLMKIIFIDLKNLKNIKYNHKEDEEYNEEDDEDYIDGGEEEEEEEVNKNKKSNKRRKYNNDFLNLLNINSSSSNNVTFFNKLNNNKQKTYIDKLKLLNDKSSIIKPNILNVVDLNTSDKNKKIILNKVNTFNSIGRNGSGYTKLNNWITSVMEIPFGNYINIAGNLKTQKSKQEKIMNVKKCLDNTIYGHNQAKNMILQHLAELITNKNNLGNILTLEGPPGIGKTALIQDGISKGLGVPFHFISLGGATDSSHLEGFDYTYEGSIYGKIADILIQSKCMNPIIYFDELDKVSETNKGEEIINILTHITDQTQNSHFNDKYFSGIDLDLSKVMFIFSCNNINKVSKILRDRMFIVELDSFNYNDKIQITNNYLLPKLYKKFAYDKNKIVISDNVISYIIDHYTYEGGVRKLKENLYELLREINLRYIQNKKILNKNISFPLEITIDTLRQDIFNYKRNISIEKVKGKPQVGLINGLWACDYGTGGILPIEVVFALSNNNYELELTGSQGDVMKESMKVAKNVSWNLLTNKQRTNIIEKWKTNNLSGIHIHCPDGATPKDGPSAGCAITISIYSLLTNRPIKNDIAITGEITLNGNITEIGGLENKIYGAIRANIKHILYPKENQKDVDRIIKKNKDIENMIKLTSIENIQDTLKHVF